MSHDEAHRNVVSFDRTRRRIDPARVSEFAATARKLQREREESGDAVARVLRDTPRAEWPRLVENERLRNAGVLEQLGREVVSAMDRDPQRALALSNLVTSIAETLAADAYPPVVTAQLRAHAWKDRAGVLRYVGRYDEAFQAVHRAEALLAPYATVAHDLAVVRFLRATILQQVERFDESERLLDDCASVFFDHGDLKRYVYCSIARGTLLFRKGEYRDARNVFGAALDSARAARDIESEARIQNNLCFCAAELGDFAAANIHSSAAKTLFVEMGRHAEAARSDSGLGYLLMRKGNVERATELLLHARATLRNLSMIEEAGLCALEVAEARLNAGDEDAARRLVRETSAEFAAADLNHRALRALQWLDEHPRAGMPRHVAAYIAALRGDPTREFALPA